MRVKLQDALWLQRFGVKFPKGAAAISIYTGNPPRLIRKISRSTWNRAKKEKAMKTIAAVIGLILVASVAQAQSTFVYGPQGQYQGQVMQNPGGSQFFYGPQGQYEGSALPSVGGSQFYYGPRGEYQGQTMQPQAEPVYPASPTLPWYTGSGE